MNPHFALLAAVAVSLTTVGCSRNWRAGFVSDSAHVQPAETNTLPASVPKDVARVVFVRPTGYMSHMRIDIIDGEGRYLGTSEKESYFYADIEPGAHTFVGWSFNTEPLHAVVEAGKEYYVEVTPEYRFLKPVRARLRPVSKRFDNWHEVPEWLDEFQHTVVDRESGQTWIDGYADEKKQRIRKAERKMANYDEDERDEHTLRAEDGRPPLIVSRR